MITDASIKNTGTELYKTYKNRARAILAKGSDLKYFAYKKSNSLVDLIKKYRTGTQPVENLLSASNLQDSSNLNSLNLSPIKVIPSFAKKIKQRMLSQINFPSVRSYDPLSVDEHRQIAAQIMYEYLLMPVVLQMGGVPSEQTLQAVSQAMEQNNELPSPTDLYNYILNIKNKTSASLESIINKIVIQNEFDQQLDKFAENIICFNIGFFHIDTHSEIPTIKSIPTEFTIYPPESRNNYDLLTMPYAGYIEPMYVYELLSKYDFELDSENGKQTKERLSSLDPYTQVDVMYFYFTEQTEKTKYIKKGKKYKNIYITDNKPKENKNYDIEEKKIYYNVIKEGLYLPDYNCLIYIGELPMSVYPDKRNPIPPIFGTSPQFVFGTGTSIVEDMIPHSDMMHISLLKLMQLIAKARPKGIAMDLYAMAETLNSYSSPIEKDTIIAQYNKEGNIVFTSVNEEGERVGITLQELVNGIDRNTMLSLIDTYNFNLSIIRQITGINEAADATDPNPKSLVGVQQLALTASVISTKDFVNSLKTATDYAYTYLLYIVANICKYNPETILNTYYSDNILEGIDIISRISMAELHIDVKPSPSEEEIAAISSAIQMAVESQKITEIQLIEITKAISYEQKAQLLDKFIQENQQAAAQAAEQSAQMQIEVDRQKTEMQESARIKAKQIEHQLEMEMQEKKTQDALLLKEKEHSHKMEQIALLVSQQEEAERKSEQILNSSQQYMPEEEREGIAQLRNASKDSSGEGKMWSAKKQKRNLLANFFRIRK